MQDWCRILRGFPADCCILLARNHAIQHASRTKDMGRTKGDLAARCRIILHSLVHPTPYPSPKIICIHYRFRQRVQEMQENSEKLFWRVLREMDCEQLHGRLPTQPKNFPRFLKTGYRERGKSDCQNFKLGWKFTSFVSTKWHYRPSARARESSDVLQEIRVQSS